MQLLITHLTRMAPGYVCIAGQDIASHRTVRPVLRMAGRWARNATVAEGGIISLGRVIDFGAASLVGQRPETEDHLVSGRTHFEHSETAIGFWENLQGTAQKNLREIFGPALYSYGNGAVVDLQQGECSLGILAPRVRPSLSVSSWNGKEKLRLELIDADFGMLNLAVTDLRYYNSDYLSVNTEHVLNAQAALGRGEQILMSVGLGRPFAQLGETKRHYLQVNNLHIGDDPLWSPWN